MSNLTKTIYIRATSKTALNIALKRGMDIRGTIYYPDSVECMRLSAMPSGTVVKCFKRTFGSTPCAHTCGVWNREKGKVL